MRSLKKDPAAIGKFLAVTFRGWNTAIADVPRTAKLIVEKYASDLDPAFEEDSLRQIAPLLTKESPRMGIMRPATWEAIFTMFRTYHLAEPPARVDELVDFRFMSSEL